MLALQNSRDVKLAQMQYNVALGEVGVDRAAFLPNLYTGSGLAYTHGFPSLPGGQPPARFQHGLYADALQSATEGRADMPPRIARKIRSLNLDRMRDDVIVRTATAYLELGKVRHSLDLMRSEQASGEKILEVIRERVAANQELPIEVTRSQLAMARVQERIVKLEDREARARSADPRSDGRSRWPVDRGRSPGFVLCRRASTALSDSEIVNLAIQNDRSIAGSRERACGAGAYPPRRPSELLAHCRSRRRSTAF